VVLRGGGMRSACRASSRMRDRATVRGAYLVKQGWRGSRGGIRAGRLWGKVSGGGCIVITEFGMEGLHFLHADIVDRTQFKFVHRGRWVEVDVVGERVGL